MLLIVLLALGSLIFFREQEQDIRQQAQETEDVCEGDPVDIVLAIDGSASMNSKVNGKLKLQSAKDAAIAFINTVSGNLQTQNVRVGIVRYRERHDTQAKWNQDEYFTQVIPLSSDFGDLIDQISAMEKSDSGTCTECGIVHATDLLQNSPNKKLLIIFADGEATHYIDDSDDRNIPLSEQKAFQAASDAKNADIEIFAAHFGDPNEWDDNMKTYASSPDNYVFRPEVEDWVDAFSNLGTAICDDPDTDLEDGVEDPLPETACFIYGVHDDNGSDSQFFSIDPNTLQVAPIGPTLEGANIEGLDIHPDTREIYLSVGTNDQVEMGNIYRLNPETGEIVFLGNTGYSYPMPSLSFKDTDSTLWGWANGKGLLKIDSDEGIAEVIFEDSQKTVGGIAWNTDGTILYLTIGRDLWKYQNNQLTLIVEDIAPDRIEGLEITPDGLLMAGYQLRQYQQHICLRPS